MHHESLLVTAYSHPRFSPFDASPLLFLNLTGVILVLWTSVPFITALSHRTARIAGYQSLHRFYEDKDGVADAELLGRSTNRSELAIQALCVLLNTVLSLARACIPHLSNGSTHAWFQVAIAVSSVSDQII
jgi:hypothetical protein